MSRLQETVTTIQEVGGIIIVAAMLWAAIAGLRSCGGHKANVDCMQEVERIRIELDKAVATADSLRELRADTAAVSLRYELLLDSIRRSHEPTYDRIRSAVGTAELRRIADSLVTVHRRERSRYDMLLGRKIP